MDNKIRLYEELTANSHVALNSLQYDGWMIRFAEGYTNRANSVSVIYPSTIDVEKKITYCEECYKRVDQPCVFKLTDADRELDALLESKGYKVVTPTDMQIMSLSDKHFTARDCVITNQPTKEWLDAYFEFEHMSNEATRSTMLKMLGKLQNKALYCRILDKNVTVACASAVIERGYMALLNVVTDEKHRGKGYGRKLCESILAKSMEEGATTAYLQVVQSNVIANQLYASLGYSKIYSYWYRVKL